MEAQAKDSSTALRKHVKPLLQDAGSADVTKRKFWRRVDGKIDTAQI